MAESRLQKNWSESDETIRIVLVGLTGTGKSTTGNKILGEKVFRTAASFTSVTSECQKESGNFEDQDVDVVDTPGFFDTEMAEDEVTNEIDKCVELSAPGPHVFILVIRIGRITRESIETVEHFKKRFGNDMMKHVVVLFTGKEDLESEKKNLNDMLRKVPPFMKNLLKECDGRVIAFSKKDRKSEVSDLFLMINRMVLNNAGRFYTCEYFRKVTKYLRVEKEKQRKLEEDFRKLEVSMRNRHQMNEDAANVRSFFGFCQAGFELASSILGRGNDSAGATVPYGLAQIVNKPTTRAQVCNTIAEVAKPTLPTDVAQHFQELKATRRPTVYPHPLDSHFRYGFSTQAGFEENMANNFLQQSPDAFTRFLNGKLT